MTRNIWLAEQTMLSGVVFRMAFTEKAAAWRWLDAQRALRARVTDVITETVRMIEVANDERPPS